MFSNIAAGDLVGNALIAEGVQKPIEYLGRVTNSDGLKDTGFQRVSSNVIEKRQQSRQTTNPSDQINGAMIVLGNVTGSGTGLTSLGSSDRLAGRGRF